MRALAVVCALALATGTGEHAEERSHVDSTSTLVLLDGRRVSSREAFSVPLVKGVVDAKRRAELLLQLRFAQTGLLADTTRESAERSSVRSRARRHHMRHNRAVRALLDEDVEADGEDAAADDLELHSWHSRHGSRRRYQPAAHPARASAVDIDLIDGHRDGRLRFASAESGVDAAAEAEAQAAREMDMAAAGVDVDDEPLQAQILSQKRLATYYGEVHLGDQPFKVLFDTGSCEFWVPSSNCDKHTTPAERCGKHSQYHTARSKKGHRFSETQRMLIQYLSGKVEGDLVVEDVRVGSLSVPEQIVGIAETIDVPLLDEVRWDGILGLAYPSSALAKKGVTPFFDNLMAKKLLQDSIFGYYLGPRGGMVTFGAVDRKYIQPGAEFVYAGVTHRGYWTVGIVDILLTYPGTGRVSTGVCKNRKRGMCKAIVDTGTYLVYGPASEVKGALRDIQSSSCAAMGKLPSITFQLYGGGGNAPNPEVTLSPADYTLQFYVPSNGVPADECSQAQYEHPDGAGIDRARCTPDCVTGIAPDKDTLWTLGQVFLRNFYAVFDRTHNRIGFARAAAAGAI